MRNVQWGVAYVAKPNIMYALGSDANQKGNPFTIMRSCLIGFLDYKKR